jgi:hypothetical protein
LNLSFHVRHPRRFLTRAARAFLGRSTVESGDRHAIAHAHLSAAFWSKRVEQAIETVGRLARAMA